MALRISSCITGTPESSPRRPVPSRFSASVLRTSAMTPSSLPGAVAAGSSASTISVSLWSSDSILPRMISFAVTFWIKAW